MSNEVLDMFVSVKRAYAHYYGEAALYTYDPTSTNCLTYWAKALIEKSYFLYGYLEELLSNLAFCECDNMLLIKYNSLFVDFDAYKGFYRHCRGIVLDIYEDEIILLPYEKFFNINEKAETQLPIVKANIARCDKFEVSEKIDGSMQSFRYYRGEIVGAGSSSCNIENSYRLAGGYEYILESQHYCDMLMAYPQYTFIFEYVAANDPHVVQYDESQYGMYLTGIRDVESSYELTYAEVYEIGSQYNVLMPRTYGMSFGELLEEIDTGRPANEAEGYVINVCGPDRNRKYKLKYAEYVALHHVINKIISPNAVIEATFNGTYDDLYAQCPAGFKGEMTSIHDKVIAYIKSRSDKCDNYFSLLVGDTLKEKMIWITENVPTKYQGQVRCLVLGKEYNLGSIKMSDIMEELENE